MAKLLLDMAGSKKAFHYVGMGLAAIGLLSFFSVFVTGAMRFGDFSHFDEDARSSMLRGAGGMFLMFVGGILSMMGRANMADSGISLISSQARNDLERWKGGIDIRIHDASNETAHVNPPTCTTQETVKIRCGNCQTLNKELAKFCVQCGRPI